MVFNFMKKNLYICNIEKTEGLFNFKNTNVDLFKNLYEVTIQSEDNITSIYDITMNIIDEEPDIVLLYMKKNNIQLVLSIIKNLIIQEFNNIVIYFPECNEEGILEINNVGIKLINKLEILLDEDNLDSIVRLIDIDAFSKTYIEDSASVNSIMKMKNGFEMYLTGNYLTNTYVSNVKHMEVEEGTDIPFEEISPELLNINSGIIYDVKSISNKFYNDLKSDLNKNIYSHIHQISNKEIKFDDDNSIRSLKRVKYSEYDGKVSSLSYIEISDKKDIDSLIDDVNYFSRTGKIRKLNLKLINACSWNNSSCTLSKLTRCRVDKNLNVLPCINCSSTIGKVTDDHFELLKSASKIINKTRIQSNCQDCQANNYCSKCSMLPDDISREEFCNAMKNNPMISEYIFKSLLLGSMIEESKLLIGCEYSKLEISNSLYPLVLDKQVKSTNFKGNLFTAFRLEKELYVLSFNRPKIIKTDARFIFIAECKVRNIEPETIIEIYSNKFSIKLEEAGKHVFEALKIIEEAMIA